MTINSELTEAYLFAIELDEGKSNPIRAPE